MGPKARRKNKGDAVDILCNRLLLFIIFICLVFVYGYQKGINENIQDINNNGNKINYQNCSQFPHWRVGTNL